MVAIKKYREEAGMDTVELAQRLKVTKQAVWAWEAGKARPDLDNLFAMARIFDCRVEDLYTPEPSA